MAMLDHEKIIEALAATLENEVLPALGKGPARLQLYSVLDVLENLSAYLEWGGQLAELEVAACRGAASQLAGLLEGELSVRCRDFAAKTGGGNAALETARTLLVDVIESPAFDSPEVRAAVDACLGESVLTAAMFMKPPRLTEVSKG
jgi:hypothetical protein